MWSRKEDAGWSDLAVQMNKVLQMLEQNALSLVLMCAGSRSRVPSRQFLLFCVYRSVPLARLHGLVTRTTAVLALRPGRSQVLLDVCGHSACDVVADASALFALAE